MSTIVGNKIVYESHSVVCAPDCADAEYLEEMQSSLSPGGTAAHHVKELDYMNNDGTWEVISN